MDKDAVRKWNSANPFPGVSDAQRLNQWTSKFNKQFPDYHVITKIKSLAGFLCDWPEFPSQHWLQITKGTRAAKERYRPGASELSFFEGEIFDPRTWLKWSEAQKFETAPSFFVQTDKGLCCHALVNESMPSGLRYWEGWNDTTKTPWGFASADRWEELRLVKINWARSDRKLKLDFAEWLKENRPDDRQAYHRSTVSDSRRTTERDSLKFLGAWRLLRHFNGDWQKAAEYSENFCMNKRGKPKPLYVEQSEWRDAEKRANKALSEFSRKVFG